MMISWAAFAIHALLAFGLVFAAFAYARRIGGFGPWLLAVPPMLDVLTSAVYRVASATMLASYRGGHGTMARMESVFTALRLMDVGFTLLGAILIVCAFVLMRASPAAARA